MNIDENKVARIVARVIEELQVDQAIEDENPFANAIGNTIATAPIGEPLTAEQDAECSAGEPKPSDEGEGKARISIRVSADALHSIKLAALNKRVTVKRLVLEALRADGVEILRETDEDPPSDTITFNPVESSSPGKRERITIQRSLSNGVRPRCAKLGITFSEAINLALERWLRNPDEVSASMVNNLSQVITILEGELATLDPFDVLRARGAASATDADRANEP